MRNLTSVAAPRFVRAVGTVAFAMLALAAAPVHAQSSGATPPPRPVVRGIRPITLTSTAFESGGLIPDKHAQTGRDVSPALAWSGAPDSARSFVLLVHDLDAPTVNGTDDALHWLVWNIPGSARGLPEGVPSGAQRDGVRQISVSGPYYRGPAAPAGGPLHHYVFELYALDNVVNVPPTTLSPALTRAEVLNAIASHVIGKGVLVGRYRRPAPTER